MARLWLHFPIQNQSGRQGRHIFFKGFTSSLNADFAETDTEMCVANISGIGRAHPDTLVTPPPSGGCGSQAPQPATHHSRWSGRWARTAQFWVSHSPQAPPVRARGGGAALCGLRHAGSFSCSQSHLSCQISLTSILLL